MPVANRNGTPRSARISATGNTTWPARFHVQNRHVDARMTARQVGGPRDVASRPDDLATEVEQHVLEQQADHGIILNHEDANAFEFIECGHAGCRFGVDRRTLHRPSAKGRGTKWEPPS